MQNLRNESRGCLLVSTCMHMNTHMHTHTYTQVGPFLEGIGAGNVYFNNPSPKIHTL